jgi:hypothetical protein
MSIDDISIVAAKEKERRKEKKEKEVLSISISIVVIDDIDIVSREERCCSIDIDRIVKCFVEREMYKL